MIVGLGNPGAEYRGTRHNVGFMVVDALAEALGIDYWQFHNYMNSTSFIKNKNKIRTVFVRIRHAHGLARRER